MIEGKEEYIGDGVYISYDGFMFKLTTERDGHEEVIYMEPDVVASFNRYVKRMTERPDGHRRSDVG